MSKPNVVLTTGLPGCGKTTEALKLVDKGYRRVNMDSLRKMLDNNDGDKRFAPEYEAAVLDIQDATIKILADYGFNIVVDNTHLSAHIPSRIRKLLGSSVEFDVIDLTNVPADEAKRRDDGRAAAGEHSVGHKVVDRMAATLERTKAGNWRLTKKWLTTPDYPKVLPYVPDLSKPDVVIVDIDGTVAINDGHRGHYEYDKVNDDKPNQGVIDIVNALSSEYEIIFMSGREDRCRLETQDWLFDFMDMEDHWPKLFMRTTNDHRPDFVIKGELFDAHIRNDYNVIAALDDRNQVVRLYRDDLGITCLQVADGNF